ncbi:ferric-chelate reductase Frp1 [Neocucurbitaria cava]|uniref:ferric-chelate reductase (NADPH) n=1 Tax=Neocucurbitaria cava TaxID=798079 RepID=A0A9W8Y613_9PLEO|nr:ferric-chelate reductase Frp1 [Neocucurbitaria cava]
MGYFLSAWAPYDFIGYQLKNNKIVWKGLAAWCTLVWIVFSSMTPVRGWCYELFVIQHLVSFALFLGFVYIHTPIEMNAYVWIPVALFFFDRVFRALRVIYANASVFHPSQKSQGHMDGIFACKAEFTPLPHNTTRIVIRNPPISWTPGQHVFLSCHSIVPLQSHPFTVASIPEDGRMEFLVKAENGGTKRFFRHAEKTNRGGEGSPRLKTVAIEGPYGCLRPLRQFDSVILFAGSTGATFTMPLLSDIIRGWREIANPNIVGKKASIFNTRVGAATRHVRFVWVVKSKGQLSWFSEQLSAICSEFQSLQGQLRDIKLELTSTNRYYPPLPPLTQALRHGRTPSMEPWSIEDARSQQNKQAKEAKRKALSEKSRALTLTFPWCITPADQMEHVAAERVSTKAPLQTAKQYAPAAAQNPTQPPPIQNQQVAQYQYHPAYPQSLLHHHPRNKDC